MKSTTSTISRRNFLKFTALAGGGFAIGFPILSSCKSEKDETSAADINAYIKFGKDGVITILAPNPEIGQGVKTSLPMLVAEELDVDWKQIKVEQVGFDPDKYTRQIAGGSGSVRASWEPFRKAGATARYLFIAAAAQRWDIDTSACSSENGFVLNNQNRDKIAYKDLLTEAAKISLPDDVKLKDVKAFKLIGTAIPNVDNHDIVTGQHQYGIDTKREGMLYATIVRPPFGFSLKSFDDTAAKQVAGIEKILSYDNKVVVLGRSTWEVFQGAAKIKAEYGEVVKPENSSDYMNHLKQLLKGKPTEDPKRKDGNIQQAFSSASSNLEAIYEAPFLAHNTLEPMNFFAHVKDDSAELHGPIQTPERTRKRIAEVTDLPEEKISIYMTRMGGGFGRRLMSDFVEEAVMVSKLAGNIPVNVVWTREHDMTGGFYRPMYAYHYRAAIDNNNNITAWHNHAAAVNDNPAAPDSFPAAAIPNFQVDVHQYTSPVSTAPWRAPTHNYLAFAEQSFLDEIAYKMAKDPVTLRLELLERAQRDPVGKLSYDPVRYAGVIKKAAEVAQWGKSKDQGIFQGFAAHFSFETYVAQVAEIVKQADGKLKVTKIYCVADCGVVVNRSGAETQLQGGVIDGLGHALYAELTLTNGKPDQRNFGAYRLIKMAEAPEVDVHFIENQENPTGLGEPGLPPAAPAVANAVFAATGTRLRAQPFIKSGLFA